MRDNSLTHKAGGVWFIKACYRLSPAIARTLDRQAEFKALVRSILDRLVRFL